jgi:hypothetical protein
MNRQVSNKLDKSPDGITYYRGKKLARFIVAGKSGNSKQTRQLKCCHLSYDEAF